MTNFKIGDRVKVAEGATYNGDRGDLSPAAGKTGQIVSNEYAYGDRLIDDQGDVKVEVASGEGYWVDAKQVALIKDEAPVLKIGDRVEVLPGATFHGPNGRNVPSRQVGMKGEVSGGPAPHGDVDVRLDGIFGEYLIHPSGLRKVVDEADAYGFEVGQAVVLTTTDEALLGSGLADEWQAASLLYVTEVKPNGAVLVDSAPWGPGGGYRVDAEHLEALEDWEVALLTEPDQMDRDDLDDPFDDFYALDEMGEVPAQVGQPSHYQSASGLEAIDVIEGFDLNYRLGNVCKYVLRAGKKGDAVEDLLKARQYLNREINAREGRASW